MTLEKVWNIPFERPKLSVKEKNSWDFFHFLAFRLSILWGKYCPMSYCSFILGCNYDKTSTKVCFRGSTGEQKRQVRMSPLKHTAKISWSGTAHGGPKCDS